jgi:hypothetical protein
MKVLRMVLASSIEWPRDYRLSVTGYLQESTRTAAKIKGSINHHVIGYRLSVMGHRLPVIDYGYGLSVSDNDQERQQQK